MKRQGIEDEDDQGIEDEDDHFPLFWFQNEFIPSSHPPLNLHNDANLLSEIHIPQYQPYYQNPNLQACFHRNPIPQFPRNHLPYYMGTTAFDRSPAFIEPLANPSLETAFSQLNFYTPPHQARFAGNNSLSNNGVSHLPYSQQQLLNTPSHQSPFTGNSSLSSSGVSPAGNSFLSSNGVSHLPYSQQQLLNAPSHQSRFAGNNSLSINGVSHLPYLQQQLLNRMRSTVPTFDHSFSNIGNHNGINLQRPRQSYAIPNANGIRLHPVSRARSIINNGLEITKSNVVKFSDMYNHHLLQSRRQQNRPSLQQLRGRLVLVAKDQLGYDFLRKKLDERKPEQTEMIFLELKDHFQDLMKHQFGNYTIQKLFEVCNEEQMTQLIRSLIASEQRLQELCVHPHGTRAIQKMIEHIKTPQQKSLFISGLKHLTTDLSIDQNGHYVIDHCLRFLSVDDVEYLIEEIAVNCIDIAMDKSGCCVLQRSLPCAKGELKELLVAEIIANAVILSQSDYGNYVVQFVLAMDLPHAKTGIIEQLRGYYVTLSMSKPGSNVVEKCLKECGEENATRIIQELMYSPNFLDILKDGYGNYVAQTALLVSKGSIHLALASRINTYYSELHSHPCGKNVLARRLGNKYHM